MGNYPSRSLVTKAALGGRAIRRAVTRVKPEQASKCAVERRDHPVGDRPSVSQNVLAVDLVVEQVETVGRFRLRLTIQLSLKGPDLFRCFQAHRQSPLLTIFESTPEVRVLPSIGVTRFRQ